MPLSNPQAFLMTKYIQMLDVRTAGTVGGAVGTVGSWYSRTINTIRYDDTSSVSLSNNLFILPTGTYEIDCNAFFSRVGRCKIRLRNVTDNVVIMYGQSAYFITANASNGLVNLAGKFTIASNKQLSVEYRTGESFNDQSLGIESNFGVEEIYLTLNLRKIG
ncbi:hypothetical protein H6G93_34480 [Nostoc sp. FACHB-973]|nr:hypothetical protein [Nostoc sp. FACHB-973]